jgi:cyclin A
MVVARVTQEMSTMQGDAKIKLAEELSKIRMVESQDITLPVNLEEEEPNEQSMSNSMRECGLADQMPLVQASIKPAGLQSSPEKGLFSVSNFSLGCYSFEHTV